MGKHVCLSDSEFEHQFETGSFDPGWFTHEAHLRLAWIHVKQYGEPKAIDNICSQLLAFTEFHGARSKYNITLTISAIKAVHHFMQRSTSASFEAFIDEFPGLKYNFKELMATHYGIDMYRSDTARKSFILPDLLPFD